MPLQSETGAIRTPFTQMGDAFRDNLSDTVGTTGGRIHTRDIIPPDSRDRFVSTGLSTGQ